MQTLPEGCFPDIEVSEIMKRNFTIIACDFDGVLHNGSWPDIGKPDTYLFSYLINCRKHGIKVILYTMREGKLLNDAVQFCKSQGLEFDCVNNNLPEMIELYGSNPRKIAFDYLLDDNVAIVNGLGKRFPDLKKRGIQNGKKKKY